MTRYGPRTSQIKLDWSPITLNNFLLKEYQFGLVHFAFSLAVHLIKFPSFGTSELWAIKNVLPEYWLRMRDEANNLEKLEKNLSDLVQNLDDHLENLKYWDFLKKKPDYHRDLIGYPAFYLSLNQVRRPLKHDLIIQKMYGLDYFKECIDQEIEFYKSYKTTSQKKGRPIETKQIIALLWSKIIQYHGRTRWIDIEAIMKWFFHKLEKTKYGFEIERIPREQERRRFKNKYNAVIIEECEAIFIKTENPNNPMNLQIKFTEESPQLWGLDETELCETSPIISFPDGTNFP